MEPKFPWLSWIALQQESADSFIFVSGDEACMMTGKSERIGSCFRDESHVRGAALHAGFI